MQIKVKKLDSRAVIPTYATDGSGCFDVRCIEGKILSTRSGEVFSTGLSFEIPKGYVLDVYSRSGHGFVNDVRLANSVGIIDSDYRGELKIKLTNDNPWHTCSVKDGERIAQCKLTLAPKVEFVEVDELSETERGTSGFGSTGKV